MTRAMRSPVTFPLDRAGPLDPPPDLRRWSLEGPIRPLLYADGHVGWLVTGYSACRAILADPRFSADLRLRHPPVGQPATQKIFAEVPGFFFRDPPRHRRFRRLLTGQFTVHRMKMLESRIEQIASERLDAMEHAGPPADLVQEFALPVPTLVICELLGVPYSDHHFFQRRSTVTFSLDSTPDQVRKAIGDLMDYMGELAAHKRSEPGDDLISGLIATGQLTDDEINGLAMLLLVAGHDTTANMLSLGTFALLQNPAQLAALRDDPSLVSTAVEELLRYLTIAHVGLVRVPSEDVEVEGQVIKAGESVTLALAAANRDRAEFEHPDTLDVKRQATGHLAFGHGIHQCLGQHLARSEMRIGYRALLERFPALGLAVPVPQVPMRTNRLIYGVHQLPVTW